MSIKHILKDLEDLYLITGEDWVLTVHHILTEPLCPTVTIKPEGWNMVRYRIDHNTIEEGVRQAANRVRAEVINRKIVGHAAPFTNPDDKAFAEWLVLRAAGNDSKLPEKAVDK